jgi:hypothetical protein
MGIAYLWGSLRLPMGTLEAPRSGIFPLLVAILLIAVSIVLLVRSEGASSRSDETESFPKGADLRRVGAVALALVLSAACLKALGYLVCTTALMAAVVRLLGSRSWGKVALAAVLTGLLSYFLFVFALDVPLPRGEVFR